MNIFGKIRKIASGEKGNLMVESLVGLSLITVGMLGILGLVSNSIKMNHGVGVRFTAANLAAEGVEIVRNMVDADIAQGDPFNASVPPGNYRVDYESDSLIGMEGEPAGCGDDHYLCIDDDGNYNYTSGSETVFKRTISIDDRASEDPPRVIVNSRIEWAEGGQTEVLNVEDHFFDWRD